MKVSFIVNPVEGGWSPWDTRVGGSEESVIEWSKRLKERGHEVAVYHNGRHGILAGVRYRDRLDYRNDAGGGVTVNVNYPDLSPQEPTIYWTTLDTQFGRDLSAYKKILYISQYQRKHCFDGKDYPNMGWLPPGYDSSVLTPGDKIPGTVLYASSPDRGLSNLLKVWPSVVGAHPSAQLLVTYGGSIDLPNVMCLGEVSNDEMNDLYKSSEIWCHPASGVELYCMTGIKAQASGCVPVYFPTMALAETVVDGIQCAPDTLADALVDALSYPEDNLKITQRLSKEHFPDWKATTDMLENELLALA